jgi:hypothetical protein
MQNNLFSLHHLERPSGEEQGRGTNQAGWRQFGKVVLEATHNTVWRGGFLAKREVREKVESQNRKKGQESGKQPRNE